MTLSFYLKAKYEKSAIIRKFACACLANDCSRYYCYYVGSHTWRFEWHIYNWTRPILKEKVEIMHISTVNIFEMVTDMIKLLLPSNRKSRMGFQLAYLHLTLACYKREDHVRWISWKCDRIKLVFSSNSKSYVSFRLAYLYLTMTNSKI